MTRSQKEKKVQRKERIKIKKEELIKTNPELTITITIKEDRESSTLEKRNKKKTSMRMVSKE